MLHVERCCALDELGARRRCARALVAERSRRNERSQKRVLFFILGDRLFVLGDCCGLIGELLFEERNSATFDTQREQSILKEYTENIMLVANSNLIKNSS